MIFGRLLLVLYALCMLHFSDAKGKKAKGSKGCDICAFDPLDPVRSSTCLFLPAYCYDKDMCFQNRCEFCGVSDVERNDYFCTPPQEIDSIYTPEASFIREKDKAKCTQCCSGKVSSVRFEVTKSAEYSIDSYYYPDAWFVECTVLEGLLNGVDVSLTTEIFRELSLQKGDSMCIAPVKDIIESGSTSTATLNVDACTGGPSEGLKSVFYGNDVVIDSAAFPSGFARFHISCSQTVNVGTCMVDYYDSSPQLPPPEGGSCEPYPSVYDGSSTGYWSEATAKYCNGDNDGCFRGTFRECDCDCGGCATPSPTPSPTDAPTPCATDPPTDAPTPCATDPPTEAPTPSPSKVYPSPTPSPTDAPTPCATDPPTDAPTPCATDPPTEAPTPSPSKVYPSPTPSPTDAPTPCATDPPTDAPTPCATDPPTDSPTPSPTPSPTHSPTRVAPSPTPSPTDAPTPCATVKCENVPDTVPIISKNGKASTTCSAIDKKLQFKIDDIGLPFESQKLWIQQFFRNHCQPEMRNWENSDKCCASCHDAEQWLLENA